jgi:hypothetical protein
MDRVFAVVVHFAVKEMDPVRPAEHHFNIVADDDYYARGKAMRLARENWRNLYGKKVSIPNIDYCETELIAILSEDVYGIESVDGG